MKKNLLALAVAGAFAAPAAALAQSSFVQIYGTLNADLEAAKADGGAPLLNPTLFAPTYGVTGGLPGVNGVIIRPTGVNSQAAAVRADAFVQIPNQAGLSSNSSNIGFRGSEDLGGGLKGIFQIESLINLDTGGGNLGGRNSNVGLASNWGTAFYGQWDTPYKFITLKADPFFATSAPSFNSVIGAPGFNVLSTTVNSPTLTGASLTTLAQDAAFDRRQGNSVQYWSPDFAGFSGRLMYSAGERTQNYALSGVTTGTTRAGQLNPWMWGASLQYDNGPIYAAASYEQHQDYFGTRVMTGTTTLGSSSKDWGGKVVIGAQNLWGFSLYGVFERLSYSTDGLEFTNTANSGLVRDWKRNAYGFMGTYGFGNFTLRAGWMTANDASCTSVGPQICNADGTGTNQYSIGGSYNFSKRTLAYLFYTLQDNGDISRYRMGTNTGPVQSNVPVGGQAQAYGLGIRHTF
ncbi:MAG TPA: porin [Burkholderiales bacterium]|nr:porin [Burkholderiales bacterium]